MIRARPFNGTDFADGRVEDRNLNIADGGSVVDNVFVPLPQKLVPLFLILLQVLIYNMAVSRGECLEIFKSCRQ